MTSVAISTISYDSMDNGNSFLFTLPVRRKDYATEKYFFVCGFGAVSALIVAIACGILLLVRKSEMTAGVLGVETMICLLIVLLLADLLVPLQIKFGAEKSKIVILATVGILVLGFEIMKNLDQYMQGISSWGRNLWQIISSYKNFVWHCRNPFGRIAYLHILDDLLPCAGKAGNVKNIRSKGQEKEK